MIQIVLITCYYKGGRERQKEEKDTERDEEKKGDRKEKETRYNDETQKKHIIFKQMFNMEKTVETTKGVLRIITGEGNLRF